MTGCPGERREARGRQTGRQTGRQRAPVGAQAPNTPDRSRPGGHPHVSAFQPHPAAAGGLRLDPDGLRLRDRACLRLLGRAEAATAAQLATLLYCRRRTAQDRLQRLWEAGLLERTPAPEHRPGTSPYAYRLSPATRLRLGIGGRRPAGPTILRHTLDAVAVVVALVAHGRSEPEQPVQAWLPERMLGGLDLGAGIAPDGLVVLQVGARSGVLCLEVDEGTQHAGVVRPRIEAYARALASRPGWALLVAVPTPTRAAWLGRLAARIRGPSARSTGWVVVLGELERDGLAATVAALGTSYRRTLAETLPDASPRRTDAPVGTAGWIELLGAGGGERLAEVLRP